MSHWTQPVFGAHGSTRKVEGSAIIRKSAAPCISGMAKPPPGVNTGNTVRCEVSFASSVVVMETPFRISFAACDGNHRLAAQHAMLVRRTRSARDRAASSICFSISRAQPLLLVAPKIVALDETQGRAASREDIMIGHPRKAGSDREVIWVRVRGTTDLPFREFARER